MRVLLIAAGVRPPDWVSAGFRDYAGRLPPSCRFELVEVATPRRRKGMGAGSLKQAEAERLLAAVPRGARVIALDPGGRQWSTEELARRLSDWQHDGRDVALLVGGPDGLAPVCLERADEAWSLSRLTYPHMLVRVILAEQLYRAWSLLSGHPYHRA